MLAFLLIIVVLGVIGYAGWVVLSKKTPFNNIIINHSGNKKDGTLSWAFINDEWKPSATPPSCPDPLLSQSPVDLTQATAILYPGQTRNLYKPHGGFLFGNNTDNDVNVALAMDAKVIDGVRYLEAGDEQYMFDFENACGVQMRYDHLLTLTDTMQQIADQLPEATESSHTTPLTSTTFKAGELIATAVGHPAPKLNVGMDFGVYDLRKPNEASKNATYAAAHNDSKSQAFYATCWLNSLPSTDKTAALALPGGDGKAGKTSDYCK